MIMLYITFKKNPFFQIPSQNTTEVQKHIPLCALLSSNTNFHFTGKWYFEDCGKEGYGFVCEKMQGKKYLLLCSFHLYGPLFFSILLFHFTCCITDSHIANSARHRFFLYLHIYSHLISANPGLRPLVGFCRLQRPHE